MKKFTLLSTLFFATLIFSLTFQACSSDGDDSMADQQQEMDPYLQQFNERLTPFEREHGIGPIDERIEIPEEIDPEMVTRGQNIYKLKCESCHSMEQDVVGPTLADVVERRSPEFIMNFILNPGENVLNHPVGLDLLAEHHTEMPYRNVSRDEARAIYEYLRDVYIDQES
ncbi:MAG: c-type cytochrome [Bacteroidetes bacterium]|jgi:mono/diheme cytochrome c family protein|nr:c-type cytochrome [Bacteroidota bacterium]